MAIMTRRKTAAAALVVVGIAGLSIASAAQLNLDKAASLGAGETVVSSCQPEATPIKVSFETAYGAKAYDATSVVLNDVDAACAGKKYKVTVAGKDGVAKGSKEGPVTVDKTTITLDPKVAAADIYNVAVVIFD